MRQFQPSLEDRRRRAADIAFQAYDLGDPVEHVDGWEYEMPGILMTRAVFMAFNTGQPSEPLEFTIMFWDRDSAQIADAFAMTREGVLVGTPFGAR